MGGILHANSVQIDNYYRPKNTIKEMIALKIAEYNFIILNI